MRTAARDVRSGVVRHERGEQLLFRGAECGQDDIGHRQTPHRSTEGHMGIRSIRLVWVRWAHLPDRSFRVLSYMAFRVRDEDDPPTFWGGREELAYSLGRMVPPEPEPSDTSARAVQFRKQREADFQAVKAALRPVIAAGALGVARKASGRAPTVYALRLGSDTGEATPTPVGRRNLPLSEAKPTPGGRPGLPLLGGEGGGDFDEKEEEAKETKEEDNSSKVSDSLVNPAELEMTYDLASGILGKLPDLGGTYLDRIVEIEGMRNRVIAAAVLAITENPRLAPKEAS